MQNKQHSSNFAPWRSKMHEIIFEADTREGKLFDVLLLVMILLSVAVVMLETVGDLEQRFSILFKSLEIGLTICFTLEYICRLICVYKPRKYVFSFFGIIDLLSILPTYLGLFMTGVHYFAAIRVLRLIRVFRIFKLANYLKEGNTIMSALRASAAKIIVFMLFVSLLVVVIGAVMFFVESGGNSAFTSMPRSVYWAIVTLTTVGYGDISPTTPLGQFLASIVMMLGYCIIAVPTGIVSAEMVNHDQSDMYTTTCCPSCLKEGHDNDANYCKHCGHSL